jgi:hypothetical protein
LFQAEPSEPSSDTLWLVNDIQQVGGDGVEDPRNDHTVHARPRWISGASDVAEDVVLQCEPAEDEDDVAAPLGVVGGLEVQNNGDQVLDVLDGGGLAVQMSHGRSIGGGGERVVILGGVVVVAGMVAEAVPEFGSLPLEGVSLRALLLEGVSGGADAFLRVGGGREELGVRLELLAALGVGGVEGRGFVRQPLGGGAGFIAEFGGDSRGGISGGGSHGRCGRTGAANREGRGGCGTGAPAGRALAARGKGEGARHEASAGESGSRGGDERLG